MNPILRHTGASVLALGLLAAPAFAQGMGGTAGPSAGAMNASPAQAAGSIGYNGSTQSPSGTSVNAGTSANSSGANASEMNNSTAQLPNNDAGTPINNAAGGTNTLNNPSTNPPANGMPHATTPGSGTSGQ